VKREGKGGMEGGKRKGRRERRGRISLLC